MSREGQAATSRSWLSYGLQSTALARRPRGDDLGAAPAPRCAGILPVPCFYSCFVLGSPLSSSRQRRTLHASFESDRFWRESLAESAGETKHECCWSNRRDPRRIGRLWPPLPGGRG